MMCFLKYSFISVILHLLSVGESQSAKILAVYSAPSYSHFILGFRLAEELVERGHEITMISPYPAERPLKNYTHIQIDEVLVYIDGVKKKLFSMDQDTITANMKFSLQVGFNLTNLTFANEGVQKLLKSDVTFDAVLLEFFMNEALVGFGTRFKAPIIFTIPMRSSSMNNYIFGNPSPPSYIPQIMGDYKTPMSFFQRLHNFWCYIFFDLGREFLVMPKQRELFKKYVHTDLSLDDVLYNVSLMLINSHVSVNQAVPYVPCMIEIGGFHVRPPKRLPEDLQKFLDDAKDGAIIFSMGTNLKSEDLKPHIRDGILRTFSKLKQRVLWKFSDDLPNKSDNVKIMDWLPQQSVLAHPNVQVFISHGGMLSTIEAIYFGVAILGIPVYIDQKSNIGAAVANGYAVALPLQQLNEETFSAALNEILNNPRYRNEAQLRSKIMRDQPLKPLDKAIFWIEHIIRHGGRHLRSAGLDLTWYQREMIDVQLFLIFVVVIVFLIIYLIIKLLARMCRSKQFKVNNERKNK